MTKNERLELIRQRAKQSLPLSPVAAGVLESLKSEDSDLGGPATFGETIAPEDVKVSPRVVVEDEAVEFASFISPAMRAALES